MFRRSIEQALWVWLVRTGLMVLTRAVADGGMRVEILASGRVLARARARLPGTPEYSL